MADYECEYDQAADYVPSCGGRREALLYCRQSSGSSVISELTAPTVCESYGSSVVSAPRSVTLRHDDDCEEDREGAFFNSGAVVIKRGGHRKQQTKRRPQQKLAFDASFQEEGSEFTPTPSKGAFSQNEDANHGFAADFDGAFSSNEEVGHDETLGMGQMGIIDKKSQKKLQLRAAAEQLKRNEGNNSCSQSKTSEEGDWQKVRSENQKKIMEDSRGFAVDNDFGASSVSHSQIIPSEPHWEDSSSRQDEGPLAKKLTSKAIRSVGNIIKVGGGALLHVASKKPSNYDGLDDDDQDAKKGFSFGGLVGANRRGQAQSVNDGDAWNGRSKPDGMNFADPDRRRSGAILDRINETPCGDDSNFNYSDRVITGQLGSNNTRRR